ncbi:hypothetical protein [Rhizobium sp. RM]|uniref:hypothetical protein n=1 Tax=Rhizobium sp. RM TaxID=2748079 RepID=UPI00110E5B7C|nr:hypothetical protein [Rhizobium sp. RM]NWJ24782.1 hypothetical protein [Rhizobium sp. RM]TMV16581.1 hypothetical protein BJG94_19290 [Rhizobium sp. Td3]
MTDTFHVAGSDEYQLAVDGANFSRFGLQVEFGATARVFIGAAAPLKTTANYVTLSYIGSRELAASLASTDKVYVRSMEQLAKGVRGFRESRT